METRRLLILALAVLGTPAAACFNGAFDHSNRGGGERFELVIESDRTSIDATHYLVDSTTGDVWRLDARGQSGTWVRLADGPTDVRRKEDGAESDD